MRVSPLFSRICPLLSRSRLSRPERLSFRPWRSLVRSFGMVRSFPILANLNHIANSRHWVGLGWVYDNKSGNLDGVGKPVPVSDGLAFEPHFAARGLYQAAPATAGVRRGAPSDYSAPQPASTTATLTTLELPHREVLLR